MSRKGLFLILTILTTVKSFIAEDQTCSLYEIVLGTI